MPRVSRAALLIHFDFGANLRAIAASFGGRAAAEAPGVIFSARERSVILDSLTGGALLENENFLIAKKILERFVREKSAGPDCGRGGGRNPGLCSGIRFRRTQPRIHIAGECPGLRPGVNFSGEGSSLDDLMVMNGLPRHAGQARELERSVEILSVIHLTGTAAVIKERIRLDTGGDRAGRSDDSLESVERKLEIFEKRNLPLLEFYAARHVPILNIAVGTKTTAEEILAELERRSFPFS